MSCISSESRDIIKHTEVIPKMKKATILFVYVLLFAGFSACASDAVPSSINAAEAKAMMDNDETIILVDVRTESEFIESHIDGAILVPLDDIPTLASQMMEDLNVTYIIYCRSGNRSAQAVTMLDGMGYTSLYDMGGIINWTYGTVSGDN